MQKVLGVLAIVLAANAAAAPLTYTPVNPSFGGSPLNGSVLLGEAQAINKFTAPVVKKTPADKLQAFADSLQSAILSRVTSAALRNIINVDGGLIPGTVETQDYIITVTDKGNGVTSITTTDRTTGQTNSFEISTAL